MQTQGDLACRELVELVTDFLEGTLLEEVSASIEAHLDVCDGCRLYLGQMRLTVRALRRPANGELTPELRDRLLARLRERRTGLERRVAAEGRSPERRGAHDRRSDSGPGS